MKQRRAALTSERDARDERLSALASVAGEFSNYKPALDALTRVRAVPTIFPQFDHAVRVGGMPIERFSLLHGSSGSGKTYWSIGLLLSFLQRDHFAYLIDAERTTPRTWLEMAMGKYASHPGFFADRPDTYEEVRVNVRQWLNKIRRLRDTKKVPETTSAIIVVDSIRKLVPKDQWDRYMKEVKRAGDDKEKIIDRSAQQKAAMNAIWMDELVPLLEEAQASMVVIARETEDPDADPRAKKFGGGYKVGGGKALFYDASLDMRCSRVKFYGKKTADVFASFGDLHRVDITKSKVSGKGEEFNARCFFHISNGAISPAGFDRARDLIEIARSFDIIEGTNWLKYGTVKYQGEDLWVKNLNAKPDLFARLDADVRAFIAKKRGDDAAVIV